jgi:hypothetical protein
MRKKIPGRFMGDGQSLDLLNMVDLTHLSY